MSKHAAKKLTAEIFSLFNAALISLKQRRKFDRHYTTPPAAPASSISQRGVLSRNQTTIQTHQLILVKHVRKTNGADNSVGTSSGEVSDTDQLKKYCRKCSLYLWPMKSKGILIHVVMLEGWFGILGKRIALSFQMKTQPPVFVKHEATPTNLQRNSPAHSPSLCKNPNSLFYLKENPKSTFGGCAFAVSFNCANHQNCDAN